jgi:hypothetical protein
MASIATWLALFLFSQAAFAVRFEPGVGVGLQYTDNANLQNNNKDSEVITVGYVGAQMVEDEGALTYNAVTTFNNQHYTQNTFSDQNNFSLAGGANWEMLKDRVNWFMSNRFTQRAVNSLNSNTPGNLEDSNVFTLGTDIRVPITERHNFSLVPKYDQYYYEKQSTNNRQYSVTANWNYLMSRLNNVGLNLGARKVNYMDKERFGLPIRDITFTNAAIVFNGQRPRSTFVLNLGATRADQKNGSTNTGFSGFLDWQFELTSHSNFQTLLSTDLTDTSSAGAAGGGGFNNSGNDVQVATDVVRTDVANLVYSRKDALLDTRISARYSKLNYENTPLDRTIKDFGAILSYPVTPLLTSSVYLHYNRTKQIDTSRLDKRYTAGGDMRYQFSRKLHGLFNLEYREKDSPASGQDYNSYSAFVSLVYGFGEVQQPSQTGGF